MRIASAIFLILNVLTIMVQGQESSAENQEKTIYVMGHAHMDPVYRWRWNEIINRELDKTFTDVLGALDDYPDLRIDSGNILLYRPSDSKMDIKMTYVASILSGTLATFSITREKKE